MSQKPTREELAAQAEMARLQAELAAAKAEAAKLRLEMVERDLQDAEDAEGVAQPAAATVARSDSVTSPPAKVVPPPMPERQQPPVPPSAVQRPAPTLRSPPVTSPPRDDRPRPAERPVRITAPPPVLEEPAALGRVEPAAKTTSPAAPPISGNGSSKEVKTSIGANARQAAPPVTASIPKNDQPLNHQERPKRDLTTKAAPDRDATAKRGPSRDDDDPPPKRRLISRSLFHAASAWTMSMVAHAICLILLAITMLPVMLKPDPPQLEAVQARPEEDITEVLDENVTPATEVTLNTHSSVLPTGQSQIEGSAGAEPTYDKAVSETIDGPKVNVGDVSVWSVKGRDLGVDVPEGAPGDPQVVVDNYDQAFDRITQEIMMMLVKNKVLVVWLFDQSESMKDDQKDIRDRIERVYAELGLTNVAKDDALLTAVASYGAKWQMHTRRPTADLDTIRAAINEVPIDESGTEMTCDAVGATVSALHSVATSGRRQLAMVLVSDESGDRDSNVAQLENAIAAAKAARCRLYILGREAVFGYLYAHMRWHHPQIGTRWLPIDRGPETPFAEQLQTEGFQRRYDAHPSGFGPYEHARMARETGGIFFMLPGLEDDLVRGELRRYELEAMRPYLPDLSPRHEYAFERDNHELRATLWKVISDLNPYDPVKAKVIDLRLQFSADIPSFIKQVNGELEKTKLYVTYLHEAEQALDRLKKHRDREAYPRWRANYDLILAQLLAYKVRVYEYGAYLEDFKKNPKQVPLKKAPNLTLGHWNITHRSKTITGSLTEGYIQRSRDMFAAVMKDHAGTPWAARAEYELKRGFGIELTEVYHGPPNPNPRPPSGPPVKIPKL